MNVLIDPSTGPLPWEILDVKGVRGVYPRRFDLTISGHHPKNKPDKNSVHLLTPLNVVCLIESVGMRRRDGTNIVRLCERLP